MIQNRTPINFLLHIFSEDVTAIANIVTAEAEDNYEVILGFLEATKDTIELWITQLEKERDENTHSKESH